MFYLTTHSTHGRNEGNVLFNDALNTFYLRLYGVRVIELRSKHAILHRLLPSGGSVHCGRLSRTSEVNERYSRRESSVL